MIDSWQVRHTVPFDRGNPPLGRLRRGIVARPRTRKEPARVPADRRLLELDLAAWAGARIAKGGRRDALLGRVESLHLSLDGA